MTNLAVFWFYFGTLISSIGSFVFNICLVAFMIQAGFDLFHVSLILGLQRLVPMFAAGIMGHYTDMFSPRLTVAITEAGAAFATMGILWAWSLGSNGYWFLLAFTLVKTSFISFQAGSKVKITKILSDSTYTSNANHAIWFNKATQGATLFAGLIAWPIIAKFNFETAIWFDLLTFVVNGAIVFLLPIKDSSKEAVQLLSNKILSKFKDFYKYNKRAATLDFLLAISMMGTTSFTSRLAGSDQKWMAVLIGGYGFSVWLAGFIEKSQVLKSRSLIFWLGLGISYICLGFLAGQGFLTLLVVICKDTFYWLLLHRISSHIQMDTPEEVMGSVSSARTTQMITILATGELLVGTWSKILPVAYDGLWRGVFCIVVLLALMKLPRFQSETKQGYASL